MQLSDKKIIITGGPTREWIDPVRYISNASSGKMGIAIADAAYEKSKDVVFIHGPIEQSLIKGKPYRCIAVESTIDMLNAVIQELSPNAILIMAAAPADFRPEQTSPVKIKKTHEQLTLTLTRNPDILKTIAQLKKEKKEFANVVLIGFAAETVDVVEYGKTKLKEKELAMICVNDVSRKDVGFGSDYNEIIILFANGEIEHLTTMTKIEAAQKIIESIETKI